MKFTSLLGNSQMLDGGAMFGNAPKALWSRWLTPDEHNRIPLECRCLLVQDDNKNILFETGIGSFFPPKLRERYGVQQSEHVLLKSLKKINLEAKDITHIVLSHLHFDHVGGVLKSFKEGAEPQIAFPHAKFYVGKKALERAENPHFRDRASFIPEIPRLLKENGLEIIDKDTHPDLPFIKFHYSNGHTPGLLISEIQGDESVYFVSDLIPGASWVHLPITMGYDRYPERLIEEKKDLLEQVLANSGHLFYTHDPKWATSKVVQNEKGKFVATDCREFLSGETL